MSGGFEVREREEYSLYDAVLIGPRGNDFPVQKERVDEVIETLQEIDQ